ncbi:hypothetical protein CHS0354_024062 [Potamilus streckersoni]|uniref:Uncharacterized protein n=1 Tax=Potamilus streckersoni TaxID=2493646 RepID=A0AAE0RZN5_9BIVA|nr:hypothetical protein CHS0354_024062 [Potamilus streckersoni]
MKLLSIGIQHFDELRETNRMYVDKTEMIYHLMKEKGVYFLSRPRRFGKSLLLSTMEMLALGRKDLFQGLWIEDKWDWTRKYPVIRISFTQVAYKDLGLNAAILEKLLSLYEQFQLTPKTTKSIHLLFSELLQLVHAKHGKIVLLIDEYDKPIIDFLEEKHIETATENQAIMKNFYSCLKDNGHFIHTLLITGISKFAKVSVFSELNHLDDLTLDPNYVNLLGYTQEELEKYFDEHLDFYLTKHNKETKQGLLDKIRLWYNGFSWDGENRVYNPFSILNFFQKNTFANYWFVSGTPTFLLRLMFEKKNYEFENVSFNVNSNNIYDIHKLELIPILFQTGYLTIVEAKDNPFSEMKDYVLNYPNKEVRDSFYDFIINSICFTDGADKKFIERISHGFMGNNLDEVEEVIDEMFKDVPHDFYVKQEVVLHCLLHIVFTYVGLQIQSEVHTQKGRLDAIVETKSHVYIFEFKINKTVNEAIKQIRQKEYGLKYAKTKKQLIGIGECPAPNPTYTVTLNANTGIDGTTKTIPVESGRTVPITTTGLPTKENYGLGGWNTEANGSGTKFVFGETPVIADITIYAQWTQNKPDTPKNLTAKVVNATEIDISWTATANTLKYNLFDGTTQIGGDITGTSFSHKGLGIATTHTYTIKACNGVGCSELSAAVSATTQDLSITVNEIKNTGDIRPTTLFSTLKPMFTTDAAPTSVGSVTFTFDNGIFSDDENNPLTFTFRKNENLVHLSIFKFSTGTPAISTGSSTLVSYVPSTGVTSPSSSGYDYFTNLPFANIAYTYLVFSILNSNQHAYSYRLRYGNSKYFKFVLDYDGGINPPTITSQPLDITVVVGKTATFSVSANDNGSPSTYQWQKAESQATGTFTNIAGATSTTYSHSVTADDNGDLFRVVVTNAADPTTSRAAKLTVITVPTITRHPVNSLVSSGQNATLSVVASANNGTLSYQWQRADKTTPTNFSNIAGATNASYSFASTTEDYGDHFRVVVSNEAGSVTSNYVSLNIISLPTITTQPVSVTTSVGGSVTFSIVANANNGTISYKWQKAVPGSSNFVDYLGNYASFTLSSNDVIVANSGTRYLCIVTNEVGSVTSSIVTLTVNP